MYQDPYCQYIYQGKRCTLHGTIRMSGQDAWYCYIHAQNVPQGKEKFILKWIEDNREQIAKARQFPLRYDLPIVPLNYTDKRKITLEEVPF